MEGGVWEKGLKNERGLGKGVHLYRPGNLHMGVHLTVQFYL